MANPADTPPAYDFNVEAVIFLFVPPAPSSTINKSASARVVTELPAPSISSADIATLFAVDIVLNLLSGILPASFPLRYYLPTLCW